MPQLHAPAGGVEIDGQQFLGGEFIPAGIADGLSDDQREDVAKGKSVQTTGPKPLNRPGVSRRQRDKEAAERIKDWEERGVRSDAFKAWFGDWEGDPASASKVVKTVRGKGDDGEPQETHHVITVYKGTRTETEHAQFRKHGGGAKGTVAGVGFYFAENKRIGETFQRYMKEGRGKGYLYECYLSIKNPFNFEQWFTIDQVRELVDKALASKLFTDRMDQIRRDTPGLSKWADDAAERFKGMAKYIFDHNQRITTNDGHSFNAVTGWNVWRNIKEIVGHDSINDFLKEVGYDGIVHVADDEYGTPWSGTMPPSPTDLHYGRCWIAFEPEQIKSVKNIGTFDPNDPRIRMAWEQKDGPRGGRPWVNTETGEARYQTEKPSDRGSGEAEPEGQRRAARGGELGPNGEWYNAGAWIATTEMPKMARQKRDRAASEKVAVEPGKFIIPEPGKLSIFRIIQHSHGVRGDKPNDQYMAYAKFTPEDVRVHKELAKKYQSGERWADAADYPSEIFYDDMARMAKAGIPIDPAAMESMAKRRGKPIEEFTRMLGVKKAAPAEAKAEPQEKPAGKGEYPEGDTLEVFDTNTGEVLMTKPRDEAIADIEAAKKEGSWFDLDVRASTAESQKAESDRREKAMQEHEAKAAEINSRKDKGNRPGGDKWKDPPPRLYHATFAADKIAQGGFKTAESLGSDMLGGAGDRDAVSFTTKENAEVYRDGLEVARQAATGELSINDDAAMRSIGEKFGVDAATMQKLVASAKAVSGDESKQLFELLQAVSMRGKKFPLFMGSAWPDSVKTDKKPSIVSIDADVDDGYSYHPGESEWRVRNTDRIKGVRSEEATRMSAEDWTQSKGPRGGHLWTNRKTGEVRHQTDNPGGAGKQRGLFGDDEPNREKQATKGDFYNRGGKQKNLFSGLNALPGQRDLFDDLDKPAPKETHFSELPKGSKERREMAIRSPEFKRWFGDWEAGHGSKVLDSHGKPSEQVPVNGSQSRYGKPVVAHHGTMSGGFHSFDRSKLKNADELLYGGGFYFTEADDVADEYAGGKRFVVQAYATKEEAEQALQTEQDRWIEKHQKTRPDFRLMVRHNPSSPSRDQWEVVGYGHEKQKPQLSRKITANDFAGIKSVMQEWLADESVQTDPDMKEFLENRVSELSRDQGYGRDIAVEFWNEYLTLGKEALPYGTEVDDKIAADVRKAIGVDLDNGMRHEVKSVFLNIRNPFDIDHETYSPREFQRAVEQHPSLDRRTKQHILDRFNNWEFAQKGPLGTAKINGSRAYALLASSPRDGKQAAEDVLRAMGFDGITHIGGRIMGTKDHRVWIAFEGKQIKSVDAEKFDPSTTDIRMAIAPAEGLLLHGWFYPGGTTIECATQDEVDRAAIGQRNVETFREARDANGRIDILRVPYSEIRRVLLADDTIVADAAQDAIDNDGETRVIVREVLADFVRHDSRRFGSYLADMGGAELERDCAKIAFAIFKRVAGKQIRRVLEYGMPSQLIPGLDTKSYYDTDAAKAEELMRTMKADWLRTKEADDAVLSILTQAYGDVKKAAQIYANDLDPVMIAKAQEIAASKHDFPAHANHAKVMADAIKFIGAPFDLYERHGHDRNAVAQQMFDAVMAEGNAAKLIQRAMGIIAIKQPRKVADILLARDERGHCLAEDLYDELWGRLMRRPDFLERVQERVMVRYNENPRGFEDFIVATLEAEFDEMAAVSGEREWRMAIEGKPAEIEPVHLGQWCKQTGIRLSLDGQSPISGKRAAELRRLGVNSFAATRDGQEIGRLAFDGRVWTFERGRRAVKAMALGGQLYSAGAFVPAKAMRMAWEKYQGAKGGSGWKNPATGRIVYQEDMPGERGKGGQQQPNPQQPDGQQPGQQPGQQAQQQPDGQQGDPNAQWHEQRLKTAKADPQAMKEWGAMSDDQLKSVMEDTAGQNHPEAKFHHDMAEHVLKSRGGGKPDKQTIARQQALHGHDNATLGAIANDPSHPESKLAGAILEARGGNMPAKGQQVDTRDIGGDIDTGGFDPRNPNAKPAGSAKDHFAKVAAKQQAKAAKAAKAGAEQAKPAGHDEEAFANELKSHSRGEWDNAPDLETAMAAINKAYPAANPEGIDTQSKHSTDGGKTYTPERQQLHAKILKTVMGNAKRVDNPVAVMMGGGPAPLSLDTLIPTPTGWTTIGEVQEDDMVFDGDGTPTRVVWTSPIFRDRECFEIVLDDGSRIVADAEHKWVTSTRASRKSRGRRKNRGLPADARRRSAAMRERGMKWSEIGAAIGVSASRACAWSKDGGVGTLCPRNEDGVVTTAEIAATLLRKDGGFNHAIENCRPLELQRAILPVPPYTLGAWLGDGTSDCASITAANCGVLTKIRSDGFKVWMPKGEKRKTTNARRYTIGKLACLLRVVGVLGDKHIPSEYLRSSPDQRISLLQGLMDTDGHCDKKGSCEFTTTNKQLSIDVHELLATLGIKSRISEGVAKLDGRVIGPKWRIHFSAPFAVFTLRKKLKRQKMSGVKPRRRMIVAVNPVKSVPVRCLKVESVASTFLVGESMVMTHNSGKSSILKTGRVTLPESKANIDPDAMKGAFPEYQAMLKAKHHAGAVHAHEESNDLSKQAIVDSGKQGFNAVLDGTGNSSIESLSKKVNLMRQGGRKVVAHYVTCDTDEAVKRAQKRGEKTGRFVPEQVIRDTHRGVSQVFPQAVQRGLYDEFSLWDTGAGEPVLVVSGKGKDMQVHDEVAWKRFLAKGQ